MTQKIEAEIGEGIKFIPKSHTGKSVITVYIIIALVGVGLLSCILFSLTKSSSPSENDNYDSLSDEDDQKEGAPLLNNSEQPDDGETAPTEN